MSANMKKDAYTFGSLTCDLARAGYGVSASLLEAIRTAQPKTAAQRQSEKHARAEARLRKLGGR